MAMLSKQPIPDRIANAPKLMLGSDIYFEAYCDLLSDTHIGWSNIINYCRYYNLDEYTTENLLYVLIKVYNGMKEYVNSKASEQ